MFCQVTLSAPWPEVVIALGWLPGLVGRWIARKSHAGTRLIVLGRKGGAIGETQDNGVVCRHFRLPPEPRRIDTVLPPNKVNPERMQQAAQHGSELFKDRAQPRVVLLVGGSNRQFSLDAASAGTMVAATRRCVTRAGGSLAIISSRRTSPAACVAIRAEMGAQAVFAQWSPRSEHDNPYLGFLAGADIPVVTGESESMLAEAVATGKPVYIYPVLARAAGWRE